MRLSDYLDDLADDGLQPGLHGGADVVVDRSRDTLDTAAARETADVGPGYPSDVVSEDLAVRSLSGSL